MRSRYKFELKHVSSIMIATYDGKNRNFGGFGAGFENVLEENFKAQKARASKALF